MERLKGLLLQASRKNKQLIAISNDFLLILISCFLALSSQHKSVFFISEELIRFFIPSLVTVLIFIILGVYKTILRYIGFNQLIRLFFSLTFSLAICFFINQVYFSEGFIKITAEAWALGFLIAVILIIGSRIFALKFFEDDSNQKKVVIYGAGSAGVQLAGGLHHSKEMQPVYFVDDEQSLQGKIIAGIKVIPSSRLRKLAKRKKVDEVLVAMPSVNRAKLNSVLKRIEDYSLRVRILPGLAELAQGKVNVSELKEVDISDLLGREEIIPDNQLLSKNIKNKSVLITGAGGSIGSELARQVTLNNPKRLILFDQSELALYQIDEEIKNSTRLKEIHAILGNTLHEEKVFEICRDFEIDTIYHASAYKHVPIVEQNPFEAISNNIFGTLSVVEAAIKASVSTFVFISTDKAVRPTNIMGASKRFSELILQSKAADLINKTSIAIVRFGNVVGSSGSAVPLFQKQIKEGGPVTVTHPDIIRYFMSIPEAAQLVIQAGAMEENNKANIFVLDMGEPVNILDLAKRLIRLSGKEIKNDESPLGDIEIKISGLRPGEKMYEELLIGDSVSRTSHARIFRANEEFLDKKDLEYAIAKLRKIYSLNDHKSLRAFLEKYIRGYKPVNDIADILHVNRKA